MALRLLQETPKSAPQKPSPAMSFRRGDAVEVASGEEGFVGSYYEATLVAGLVRNEYIVQYHTPVKDDLSGPLKEVVSAAEVSPTPPPITRVTFRFDDVVDAFDNDGWWVGRITGRVDRDKYFVFFETTGDEIAYPKDRLRVHQNWINGKWVSDFSRLGI